VTVAFESLVGQRVTPLSGLPKATGQATFATDVFLPGMLHATLVRSPSAHARIAELNVQPALDVPGVVTVLTYRDVPRVRFGNYVFQSPAGDPPVKRVQDIFILDDTAFFVGDELAVVLAVDRATAEDAAERISITYEPLAAVFDTPSALRPDAPLLHPDGNIIHPPERLSAIYERGSGSDPTYRFARGDVETGFAAADVVIERTYRVPFVNAASMEPRGCVAHWDGQTLTIWDSTQAPFKIRGALAKICGLPKEQIRVVSQYVGGGFGNKGIVHRYQVLAALLTMKTGRPVRLAYSRRDEFLGGLQRYQGQFTIKAGVTRQGQLTAISIVNLANWGNNARGQVQPVFFGMTSATLLYRKCPNVRYEAYATYSNLPASGAYRGFGDPESQFGMESMLDELAEAIGMDPVELKLKHCVESGDELLPQYPGKFISSVGIRECVERGAQRIGWASRHQLSQTGGPIKRGIGFAMSMHTAGHLTPATARVELLSDGHVLLATPLPDIGSEQPSAMRQLAADVLRSSLDDFVMRWADTDQTSEDFGIHASRGTFMIGRCVVQAAQKLAAQLRGLAAEFLGVPPDDLVVADGHVSASVEAGGRALSFRELAALAEGSGQRLEAEGSAEETTSVWGFAAHFAEVEVDTDTGEVRVVRLVAAADVGRAINPTVVEGQIEGAAIQGIGYALSEELIRDSVVPGTTLNANLLGYELPTLRDVPMVEPIIVESIEPLHPYGAKGCGEIGLVGVAPSIANAIYAATGVRFRQLPITPARVLDALAEAAPIGGTS
jgi:xanthine dehydrogenase molybdenum-binding subunit